MLPKQNRSPSDSDSSKEKNGTPTNKHLADPRLLRSTNPFDSLVFPFPPAPSAVDSDSDEEKDEEKSMANIASQPFHYLHIFPHDELRALEKRHNMLSQELDRLVQEHQGWYGFFLADTLFARGTDIASIPFETRISRDGLESGVKLIYSETQVPNTFGLFIGADLALLDLAYKFATVSSQREAIKRTLDYLLREPFKQQAHQFVQDAQENPLKAAGLVVQWGFNQTVKLTPSLLQVAGTLSAFYEPLAFSLPWIGEVSVPAWLPQLPTGVQISIATSLAYGHYRNSSILFSSDYDQHSKDFIWKGLVDLWNNDPEGEPWLVGELFRGNLATPLQVTLRGLMSTLFTRAYPRFYNLAEIAFGKLAGLDPDTSTALAISATTLVGWHLFCTEYPKSYRRAMADQIEIDAILRQNLKTAIGSAINDLVKKRMEVLNFALTPTEINKQKQVLRKKLLKSFVDTEKRLLQTEILQGAADDFVFKHNPDLKLEMAAQTLLGLYWGGSTLAPFLLQYIDAPVFINLFSLISVPYLLTLTCYQAEKQRTINHRVRQRIGTGIKTEDGSPSEDKVPAGALIIASNVSRALSVLGAGKRTFGDHHHAAMSTTVVLLAENFMELLHLTYKKAQTAMTWWLEQKPTQTPRTYGPLFSQRRCTQPQDEVKNSDPLPHHEKSPWFSRLTNPFRRY